MASVTRSIGTTISPTEFNVQTVREASESPAEWATLMSDIQRKLYKQPSTSPSTRRRERVPIKTLKQVSAIDIWEG